MFSVLESAAALFGLLLIVSILWDAFETIILPRRVTRRFRFTRFFYQSIWIPWSFVARQIKDPRRRETYLGLFGPLSLLMLLAIWAFGLIFGYAVWLWAVQAALNVNASFSTYLYLSGVTFFTLGY